MQIDEFEKRFRNIVINYNLYQKEKDDDPKEDYPEFKRVDNEQIYSLEYISTDNQVRIVARVYGRLYFTFSIIEDTWNKAFLKALKILKQFK
jgi:hypothetical protein